MLLRGSGASSVELIERYSNDRRPEQQSEIYRTLAERHGIQWLDQTGEWREDGLDGIEWSIGRCAEEVLNERVADGGQPFDYILSTSVLEHLENPEKVLESSLRCLKPGGKLLHYIDLGDHDLFSQNHPELSFLRVPECIYRFMITATSGPNRIRLGEYLTMLEQLRLSFGIRYQITRDESCCRRRAATAALARRGGGRRLETGDGLRAQASWWLQSLFSPYERASSEREWRVRRR